MNVIRRQRKTPMLIEVHYGDDCTLLVNGDCRAIHILDYIRSRCQLSSSMAIDLCLINSGEPFYLSSVDSKLLTFEQEDVRSHLQCFLARIDEQGTYIPLLNNPELITNEFLAKLRKATNAKSSPKHSAKPVKQPIPTLPKTPAVKRRRSFKSIAIAATFLRKMTHH